MNKITLIDLNNDRAPKRVTYEVDRFTPDVGAYTVLDYMGMMHKMPMGRWHAFQVCSNAKVNLNIVERIANRMDRIWLPMLEVMDDSSVRITVLDMMGKSLPLHKIKMSIIRGIAVIIVPLKFYTGKILVSSSTQRRGNISSVGITYAGQGSLRELYRFDHGDVNVKTFIDGYSVDDVRKVNIKKGSEVYTLENNMLSEVIKVPLNDVVGGRTKRGTMSVIPIQGREKTLPIASCTFFISDGIYAIQMPNLIHEEVVQLTPTTIGILTDNILTCMDTVSRAPDNPSADGTYDLIIEVVEYNKVIPVTPLALNTLANSKRCTEMIIGIENSLKEWNLEDLSVKIPDITQDSTLEELNETMYKIGYMNLVNEMSPTHLTEVMTTIPERFTDVNIVEYNSKGDYIGRTDKPSLGNRGEVLTSQSHDSYVSKTIRTRDLSSGCMVYFDRPITGNNVVFLNGRALLRDIEYFVFDSDPETIWITSTAYATGEEYVKIDLYTIPDHDHNKNNIAYVGVTKRHDLNIPSRFIYDGRGCILNIGGTRMPLTTSLEVMAGQVYTVEYPMTSFDCGEYVTMVELYHDYIEKSERGG